MMRLFVLQMGLDLNTQGRTGASVFIESHNIKQVVPLGHYATVFEAEVYAIAYAFVYVTATADVSGCSV